jgi:hypothetical protein
LIEPRRYWAESRARLRQIAEEIVRLDVGEGRVAEILVRPARKEKTASQRGYWHAILEQFGQAVGYTRGQMKEVVKRQYYGVDTIRFPSGASYEIVESSEYEDRAGYGRLIDFTLALAAEQGVRIEDPRPRFQNRSN